MSENRSKCDPILYPSEYVTTIVHYVLGERCRGSFIMIPTVFVYSVILILGLFGNIFTCIVIAKNKSMHNPTNYYLFSLAISDLLMLILGLPVELYEVFVPAYPTHLNFLTCKLRAFLIEFTSYASVLTITCFSIERWLAICFPLRAQLFSTLYRATRIIISVWIISFFSASPIMSLVIINKVKLPDNDTGLLIPEITMDNLTILYTDYCSLDSGNLLGQKFMIYSAFLFFFFFPAMLISLVYYHIVQTLKKADEYLHAGNRSSVRSNSKNRKSILRMLVAVVIMFFICWFPFHFQRLMAIYLSEYSENGATPSFVVNIHEIFFYISGYCYYSNSACNPILYNILSQKYRIAFCRTILGEKLTEKLLKIRKTSVKNPQTLSQHAPSNCSIQIPCNENGNVKTKLLIFENENGEKGSVVFLDKNS